MIKKTILAAVLLFTIPVCANAQIGLLGLPPASTGNNPNGAQNDIAYNDKQRVYLQVWGHPVIYGRFLDQNGVPLFGEPFLIAATGVSDAYPRVIYTTGGADDVFIVRFTSEITRGQHLFTRLVRYTPAGPEMGPVQHVFGVGGEIARAGGMAYNPGKRQFFLTFESSNLGWEVFGQLWQLLGTPAAPLSPTIAAAGPATAIHNLTEMNNGQGLPNVAYDYNHDTYVVVFKAESPGNSLLEGSWSMRVKFDQNNALSKSAPFELNNGGKPVEQGIVYMPEVDAFLTYWTEVYSIRDVFGRFLDHNGNPTSGVFPIINTAGNEGAADAAYSPYTRSIYMAAMRDATRYIQGIELSPAGNVVNFFQSSTVVPPPPLESFYPSIAVGHDGRFALSYINTFQYVYVEMIGGPVVAGGAFMPGWGQGGTPPPPPPPPCTLNLSTTLIVAGGAGGLGSVGLSGDCPWSATSNASWLGLVGATSGTGAATVTFSIARNETGGTRSGTVTIGSKTITIQQPTFTGWAAVHDMNGDAKSDLVWHNQVSGRVAIWHLSGSSIVGTQSVNAGPVDLNWQLVGTGDLNGDRNADFVWRHSSGLVAAWLMQGPNIIATNLLQVAVDPSLPPAAVREPDMNWEIRGVGDMNGDNRADLVWQHRTDGRLAGWFMNGFHIIGWGYLSVSRVPDLNWKIAGAGDINQDGKADIIWQHDGDGSLAAWLMHGQVVGEQRRLSRAQPDLSWKVRGVGDVNGDGYADLLWQNNDGTLGVWFLQNFTVGDSFGFSMWAGDITWKVVGPG